MSRRVRDMETPEQQYARRQAGAAAERSQQAAGKHEDQADRLQMTVDVYSRQGKDYSDPSKAADAARQRDDHNRHANRHRAEAARHEANATPPQPKKRWWQ